MHNLRSELTSVVPADYPRKIHRSGDADAGSAALNTEGYQKTHVAEQAI